ncbi:acylphosphatase [Parcubacteria bacterium DG_74_2]|nr:MAG: acylphosphatase [Parcubacteria bacterium DG_74_2]
MLAGFRRVHIFVKGRVQGVFFRQSAKKKAKKIGVFGWIKNLADGRVEAVIEGETKKVEEMIEWLKKGPIIANVEALEIKQEKYQGEFKNFDLRF